jgi:hypothetical protein
MPMIPIGRRPAPSSGSRPRSANWPPGAVGGCEWSPSSTGGRAGRSGGCGPARTGCRGSADSRRERRGSTSRWPTTWKLLPLVAAAYGEGRLSYSKVRALTRVATPDLEFELLGIALAGTASHLERIARGYRRVQRCQQTGEDRRHADRYLRWHWDDEGALVLRVRLAPEEGAGAGGTCCRARAPARAGGAGPSRRETFPRERSCRRRRLSPPRPPPSRATPDRSVAHPTRAERPRDRSVAHPAGAAARHPRCRRFRGDAGQEHRRCVGDDGRDAAGSRSRAPGR